MLLFPLLAGVFSLLYSFALLFPTVFMNFGETTMGALQYVFVFLAYLGLAFIATYFNVCVVFTTKTRFSGGDATFKDSLQFANSRLSTILAWSMVAATVGLLLYGLDQLAQRLGGVGEIIITVIRSLVGMAWSIVTLFVVPVMVYEGVGPQQAIKRSAETLKATWGESLARHYGLGLIQLLFLLLGGVMAFALFALLGGLGNAGIFIAFGITLVYFLGVILTFNVANTVFNTALYVYAKDGAAPGGFGQDVLSGAFTNK